MRAVEFAGAATDAGLRRDPTAIERMALAAAPEYAARVDSIGSAHADRIGGLRKRLVAELREVDPVAAAAVTTPWPRKLALLVSALTAASAFALYFSRAQLDIEAVIPIAVTLVVVSAVLYALAVLPIRRGRPPEANVVFGGWFLVALTGATVFVIGRLIAAGASGAGWFAVGVGAVVVTLVVAVVATVARNRVPRSERTATDARANELAGRLRDAVLAEREAALHEVEESFAGLDAVGREAVVAELDAAHAELDRRGIRHTSAPAVPGTGVVADRVRIAALGVGVHLETPGRG